MTRYFRILLSCSLLGIMLTGCKSHKNLTDDTNVVDATFVQKDFMKMVSSNAMKSEYVTSKIKFTAGNGKKSVSVSGSLKMKRDDVIRIQLVPLGIMEAGRLEFTKDYVLIMDRINKQYVKAGYDEIDFLRANGINFYTLQALFWNELFQPGKETPQLDKFDAMPADKSVLITFADKQLKYQWETSRQDGHISNTTITPSSTSSSDAKMNWGYKSFKSLNQQTFPTDMQVKLRAKGKNMSMGLQLSSLDDDSGWETRTKVSSKFKKVTAESIFRMLMSL